MTDPEQTTPGGFPVSDIPEIEALYENCYDADDPVTVRLSAAESAIRSALDRQAREIVEAVRSYRGPSFTSADDVAHFIESRFAPKEADPR